MEELFRKNRSLVLLFSAPPVMITREERILCALVALHESGLEPFDFVVRMFCTGQDHRVITYATVSGVLVQMLACRLGEVYFLVAKCAQEDDRCWTVVWQEGT